ncbi:GFA family protein [Streptomyces angustmyceticus]|uniref:GFA family protein n=1 Tax=Streptomyces angustmyceticus TaxID=285578 RepID=UPI0021AE809B|nr:GFA family protein [Streptomyces angustmyceticus]
MTARHHAEEEQDTNTRTGQGTCNCTHCQRLSGGPMMSWLSFPLSGLTWTGDGGEPAWHHTWPDSRRGFCPDCGSQLCALDDEARSIAITLPALDDASGLAPVDQSFRDDAVAWLPQVPDTRRSHRILPDAVPPAPQPPYTTAD